MKKLILLSLLFIVGLIKADVVDKINPYVDKAGQKAGEKIEKKVNKVVDKNLIKPLEEQNKNLTKVRDEQKKLLEKNAEDAAKRAALALWAKIKGLFGR